MSIDNEADSAETTGPPAAQNTRAEGRAADNRQSGGHGEVSSRIGAKQMTFRTSCRNNDRGAGRRWRNNEVTNRVN